MTLQIDNVTNLTQSNGIKVLVYANAGMGKTVLASTAPAPLVISTESGLLSLRPQNIERVHGVGTAGITYDVPVIEVNTESELETVYNWCLSPDWAGYQTIFLDSFSEMCDKVLEEESRKTKHLQQAYGTMAKTMTSYLRKFRDLPNKNVVFICKSAPVKDELTGIVKYQPDIAGNVLKKGITYFFDEVFNLNVATDQATQQNYRYLMTQPDMQYEAKDRSGALAPTEAPNLTHIFNKINGVI